MMGKADDPALRSTAREIGARPDGVSTEGIYLCYFGPSGFRTSTNNRAVPAPGRASG